MGPDKKFVEIDEVQWISTKSKSGAPTILVLYDFSHDANQKFKDTLAKLLKVAEIKSFLKADTSRSSCFQKMLGQKKTPLICLVKDGQVLSNVGMFDETEVKKFMDDIKRKIDAAPKKA